MLIVWFSVYKSLPNLLFRVLCLPGDQSHPLCATDNKPSCMLHLLGFFLLGTKARILGLTVGQGEQTFSCKKSRF